MGILDSIVEWIATQVMTLLDLITGSVLGALGCDMSTFLRYFPAAETLYEVFVAIGGGFMLLNSGHTRFSRITPTPIATNTSQSVSPAVK